MVTKKKLSPWSTVGSDISDTGCSKLHAKESKYVEDKKKNTLESETLKRFADNLTLKMHHIAAVVECTITGPTLASGAAPKFMIFKEYSRVTDLQVASARLS